MKAFDKLTRVEMQPIQNPMFSVRCSMFKKISAILAVIPERTIYD